MSSSQSRSRPSPMPRPPFLSRLRYRNLRLLSSLQWWIRRRFTATGQWLLGALLATAVLGVDTNQTVAYQAFAFVLAAVVVAAGGNRFRRPRLSLTRALPRFASVGERLLYRITIRNHGR